MAIDLFILALIAGSAFLGGLTGAARQIGQLVGLLAAFAASGPLGKLTGPWMAASLGGAPEVAGQVAATLLWFFLIWVVLRFAVAAIARKAMSDPEDPEDRGGRRVDRNLGMGLAAVKLALACYVVLSALVFAERNVTAFGKRLGVSPADSIAFDLARRYNLFELTQFQQARDLARLASAATDPERAKKLRSDPAFAALEKDPRWKKILADPEVKKALESGDLQALLRNGSVGRLLGDPDAMKQIEAAAGAADW